MITLKPHQEKAVKRLVSGNILCGGVGSGKTIAALWWYLYVACGGTPEGLMRNPKDLYVFTTAKKRDSKDWETEARLLGLGAGAKSGAKLVVDSYNNMAKYKDIKGAVVICDEQRLVGKGAWSKAFIAIAKQNEWLLLSATPSDVWMDLVPVFIANGFYKNRTEFTREHVVYSYYGKYPKIDRYIGVNKLVKLRNSIMVDMPFERHTTRHLINVECDFDKELMRKVVKERWHVYEERPLKDVSELFHVMRKVVNTDSSRLQAIRDLLSIHPKLIVFYNFDYELEMLRRLGNTRSSSPSPSELSKTTTEDPTQAHPGSSAWDKSESSSPPRKTCSPTCQGCATSRTHATGTSADEPQIDAGLGSSDHPPECDVWGGHWSDENQSELIPCAGPTFAVAEWNGHKHEEIPDSDRWVYLVQYNAGAEGWNCIETNATVFFSLNYSYKMFEQAQGRIDRLNTPFSDLTYYILKSKSMIDSYIWKALSEKKSFHESGIRSLSV